jgi:hypothetical protein
MRNVANGPLADIRFEICRCAQWPSKDRGTLL